MADTVVPPSPQPATRMQRVLDGIERVGNKMPDPAILFALALLLFELALGQARDEPLEELAVFRIGCERAGKRRVRHCEATNSPWWELPMLRRLLPLFTVSVLLGIAFANGSRSRDQCGWHDVEPAH